MRDSARIIEVGAMVVVAAATPSRPRSHYLDNSGGDTANSEKDLLEMVDQMEKQLKLQDTERLDIEKGVRGCEMIRKVLTDARKAMQGMELENAESQDVLSLSRSHRERSAGLSPEPHDEMLLSHGSPESAFSSEEGLMALLQKELEDDGVGIEH